MSDRRADLVGHAYRQRRALGIRNSGGICCLCGQPMDLTVNGNHPAGPTLEHLIPVSRGGHPTHPANLSASHRQCNITRGDRLIGETAATKPTDRHSRNW